MDYSKIVKRSIELAWRFKSLWIFGLFTGNGIFFSFPDKYRKEIDFGDFENSNDFSSLFDFDWNYI